MYNRIINRPSFIKFLFIIFWMLTYSDGNNWLVTNFYGSDFNCNEYNNIDLIDDNDILVSYGKRINNCYLIDNKYGNIGSFQYTNKLVEGTNDYELFYYEYSDELCTNIKSEWSKTTFNFQPLLKRISLHNCLTFDNMAKSTFINSNKAPFHNLMAINM